MKALITYFSATGNTKLVVNEIKKILNEHDIETDLGKITSSAYFPFAEYDLIGVASPVMSFKPTYVVRDFVKDMPRLNGKMGFAVAVHGGMGVNAHNTLAKWLKSKGMKVLGNLSVWGENSFVPARRPALLPQLQGRPDRQAMEVVRNFSIALSSKAKSLAKGENVRMPIFINKPHPFHLMGLSSNSTALRLLTGNKHADKALCTKCGFCEENCPVGAISLNPYPEFNKQCFGCWSCINNCPEAAIKTFTALGGIKFPGLHRPEVADIE